MSTAHHGSGAVPSRQGSMCGGLAVSEVEGQLHGVNLDDLRTGGSAPAGRKTVDEVWRDIQVATAGNGFLRQPAAAGQMTLEDFLKQAYTNELENKISRLEEENKRLRMHKAPEPVVQYVPQQEPKNQLRRVNSSDF
uniref:Uncharacterized protein n=1 Tax=Leersia perrieri TaxID=77586 RepID=A0A0D9VTH0_9ORYZ